MLNLKLHFSFFIPPGHVALSTTDSGSLGNIMINFYCAMELYPRTGKNFDSEASTNCRFGMMFWGSSCCDLLNKVV